MWPKRQIDLSYSLTGSVDQGHRSIFGIVLGAWGLGVASAAIAYIAVRFQFGLSADQQVPEIRRVTTEFVATSSDGTCGTTGPPKKGCGYLDNGSCGNACCALTVKLRNSSPKQAYDELGSYLENGGGDGLFSKGSDHDAAGNKSPDDQAPYPDQFKPPLPWLYTTSGFHKTAKLKYKDSLFFSVGALEKGVGAQVRMFSISDINGALGDAGQNYKTLSFLSDGLGWKDLKIEYGCGKGQHETPVSN